MIQKQKLQGFRFYIFKNVILINIPVCEGYSFVIAKVPPLAGKVIYSAVSLFNKGQILQPVAQLM